MEAPLLHSLDVTLSRSAAAPFWIESRLPLEALPPIRSPRTVSSKLSFRPLELANQHLERVVGDCRRDPKTHELDPTLAVRIHTVTSIRDPLRACVEDHPARS